VVLGLITQWIPTVDPCVLVKVGLLTPTVGYNCSTYYWYSCTRNPSTGTVPYRTTVPVGLKVGQLTPTVD
jgi:hypothetical protein